MKRSLVLLAILFSFAVMASAQNGGKTIFASKCALCHGPDGRGNTPVGKSFKVADLHSADIQKLSDADLKTVISSGKNKMPPFKGKLTDAQITDVISYIRELGK